MLWLESWFGNIIPLSLLLVSGIYYTVKSKAVQIFGFPKAFRLTRKAFSSKKNSNGISSYQAACTVLSTTIGTGNIIGVAGAVHLAGPGAVFWMWVTAGLGMGIKVYEINLACSHRLKKNGVFSGGPHIYIEKALGKKWRPLSLAYALIGLVTVMISGNLTQTSSALDTASGGFGVRVFLGILFFLLTFCTLSGGLNSIAACAEKLAPIMSFLYLFFCLTVLWKNRTYLNDAFCSIFVGAFHPAEVTKGAVTGIALTVYTGASRGIFSNEAGLGTSAMAHAAAQDADPENQGLFGLAEVFIDTFLICTLTALTVLCGNRSMNWGNELFFSSVTDSFRSALGWFAHPCLVFLIGLFAFSSVIGWAFYGKIFSGYLFGDIGEKIFTVMYPILCLGCIFLSGSLSWRLATLCNGILLTINVSAMLLISCRKMKKSPP